MNAARDLYLVAPSGIAWAKDGAGAGPKLLAIDFSHEEETGSRVEWLIGLTEDDARKLLNLLKGHLETP